MNERVPNFLGGLVNVLEIMLLKKNLKHKEHCKQDHILVGS